MTQTMRTGFVAMEFAGVALGSAACGRTEPAGQAPAAGQTSAAAPAPTGPVEITFKTDPDPAKTGDNTFKAMVMQDGKPVTDATVSAEFFMAAMPAMKMPEMRMKTDLPSAGDGVYRGKGQVMMAGNWDVTVMAMRNGQELASKRVTVSTK
jgi:uncharacterized GH25 family protein